MKIKTYKYNDKTQLTPHFRVSEWKCKCGKNHDIKIADTLPALLEELMSQLGAEKGNIASGYRCPEHEKAVGGNGGKDYSHSGYAVDIDFYKNGKKINSKDVVLKLEDMGHRYGIGYRCGGATTRTHIDVKPRKWYGDEKYSMTKDIGDSYYTYFGMVKPGSQINLTLTHNVYGRNGIGFKYKKTLYKKGTKVSNCKMNVGKSDGYNWFYGYVGNQKVYFPYNSSWYK